MNMRGGEREVERQRERRQELHARESVSSMCKGEFNRERQGEKKRAGARERVVVEAKKGTGARGSVKKTLRTCAGA